VAATTALPPVKHAVHRATAPRHAHKVAHQAKPAVPNCVLRRQTEASPLPVSDLVRELTDFDPAQPAGEGLETALTDLALPQQSNKPAGAGWTALPASFPVVGGGVPGIPSGQPGAPTNPNGPDGPGSTTPGAVPEPASWAMMLFGFGAIGWMIRSARRPRVGLGKGLGLGGAAGAATALDVGTGAMVASAKAGTLGAHTLGAAVAKNIGLCVCSAAALTATVATVPPLRHALYAATMPAAERPQRPQPCAPATAAELPASSPARSS
jgi:hypothetical protein